MIDDAGDAPMIGADLDQVEVDPAARIMRASRRARKAAWLARARLINRLRDGGASVPEIAAALDVPPRQLSRMAVRFGMVVGRPHHRAVLVWIPQALMGGLQAMAERAGTDPQTMAARIVTVALEDAAAVARKIVPMELQVPPPPKVPKIPKPPPGPTKRELQRALKAKREAERKAELAQRREREKAAVAAVLKPQGGRRRASREN